MKTYIIYYVYYNYTEGNGAFPLVARCYDFQEGFRGGRKSANVTKTLKHYLACEHFCLNHVR